MDALSLMSIQMLSLRMSSKNIKIHIHEGSKTKTRKVESYYVINKFSERTKGITKIESWTFTMLELI